MAGSRDDACQLWKKAVSVCNTRNVKKTDVLGNSCDVLWLCMSECHCSLK
uniref:Uncharacterized protein n=1 Tax=Anguilla anguilla TaxID=7936 RepID=A0A0E9RT33_ANGAN